MTYSVLYSCVFDTFEFVSFFDTYSEACSFAREYESYNHSFPCYGSALVVDTQSFEELGAMTDKPLKLVFYS